MYEVSVSKINDFFSLYYRSLWDQRWHFERKFCNSLGCHSIMNTTTMGKEASLDGLGKSIIHVPQYSVLNVDVIFFVLSLVLMQKIYRKICSKWFELIVYFLGRNLGEN